MSNTGPSRPLLLAPNVDRADELVLLALRKRFGSGADFSTRSDGPGFLLHDLVTVHPGEYDGDRRYFGRIARALNSVVYDLNVHCDHEARPPGLNPKCVWVHDVYVPPRHDHRPTYLAVSVLAGPVVLMPLPTLPPTLVSAPGTVADTRADMRWLALQLADLVNLALPVASMLERNSAASSM